MKNRFVFMLFGGVIGAISKCLFDLWKNDSADNNILLIAALLLAAFIFCLGLFEDLLKKSEENGIYIKNKLDDVIKYRRLHGDSDKPFELPAEYVEKWNGRWKGNMVDILVDNELIDCETCLKNDAEFDIKCTEADGQVEIKGEIKKILIEGVAYEGKLVGRGNVVKTNFEALKIILNANLKAIKNSGIEASSSAVGVIKLKESAGILGLDGFLLSHRKVKDQTRIAFREIILNKDTGVKQVNCKSKA